MILDTSFLIDVQRDFGPAIDRAMTMESANRPRRIPLVVVYELFLCVGKGTKTEANRRRIQRLLEQFSLVSPTESIVKRAGFLDGTLRRERGSKIGPPDAIVAATALEYDEPVVTDDVRDFQRIPAAELQVETY
jgi:predicted nucleic acid-binding protein